MFFDPDLKGMTSFSYATFSTKAFYFINSFTFLMVRFIFNGFHFLFDGFEGLKEVLISFFLKTLAILSVIPWI
jgi:hypothetical protein